MANEEAIRRELINRFSIPGENVRFPRARRIFLDVDYSRFEEIFKYSISELGFSILCTITGLDDGPGFSLIYHLTRQDGTMLNIRTSVPKDKPSIRTITRIFQSADIYERELADLLGIRVEGLPEGKRYPLPDNWPTGEYPLRKDWRKTKNA